MVTTLSAVKICTAFRLSDPSRRRQPKLKGKMSPQKKCDPSQANPEGQVTCLGNRVIDKAQTSVGSKSEENDAPKDTTTLGLVHSAVHDSCNSVGGICARHRFRGGLW